MSRAADPDDFSRDYRRMVGEIRLFAIKHNLPMPTMVVGREWRNEMARTLDHPIYTDRLEYMGVPFKFGRFEQGEIFR